jgi:hypothetical protein
MDSASGNLQSSFSTQYLDLQKGICCDTGNLKLIRWNGCKPSIYKGNKTLFSSDDLALCSWFQAVDNYSYLTISLEAGEIAELQFNDTLFFLMKCLWESNSLDSLKQLEVGINKQPGVIGSTIPFPIGVPVPEDYNYTLIRDLHLMNTSSIVDGAFKLNNCSPYQVSVSIMYAY